MPWLSLAIWVPIVFGVLVLLVARDGRDALARQLALLGAIVGFLVTIPVMVGFDGSVATLQFTEHLEWLPSLNSAYSLGVDGISMWFVPLTAFITVLVLLAGWEVIQSKVPQYFAAFLILSGLMIGVFSTADGLLFYVFFEATLIPMYIIVGVWGGPNRVYAAFKFFLYTLLGSLLTLIAIVYLYLQSGTFEIAAWHELKLSMTAQSLLFGAFFMAFAVKVPMWPVHTWLPDAHVEAPTGGSMVLAAIMLKLGAYGFLRFSLPIAPDASRHYAWFIIAISLTAVIYISLVALVQKDMKKLVAYSSIAHMGFVTLGFFMFDSKGFGYSVAMQGAIIQMISHGFISAAMFFCIGVLYDRVHSREISAYGGVINTMPKFGAFFLFFTMANAGLPATSGFVGEFMVILGATKFNFWIAALAATVMITGAAYSLWMFKRVVFGAVANHHVAELIDANKRELTILALLAIAVLAMGLYPAPFTNVMDVSVNHLIEHVSHSKLPLAK